MSSSIPPNAKPAPTPGSPRAEAPSQVRQERATPVTRVHPPRHECAISAPHRWSGAAQRSEGRPPRSDRAARGARRACWGRQGRQCGDAQAAAQPGQGAGAPSGCGKRRNAPAGPRTASAGTWRYGHSRPAASPSAANSPQQTGPGLLPGPLESPTVPHHLSRTSRAPLPAPGRTWHTPEAPLKIHPSTSAHSCLSRRRASP